MPRSHPPHPTGLGAHGALAVFRALAILLVAWLATAWAEGKPDSPTRETAEVASTWEASLARLPAEVDREGGGPQPAPPERVVHGTGEFPPVPASAPPFLPATPFLERVSYSPTGPPAGSVVPPSPGSPPPPQEAVVR
jgi:hypothetical protein